MKFSSGPQATIGRSFVGTPKNGREGGTGGLKGPWQEASQKVQRVWEKIQELIA